MLNGQRHKRLGIVTAVVILGVVLTAMGAFAAVAAPSKERPTFKFGVVSDIQYCDCDINGSRFYRNSLDKLYDASQTFNSEDVDFTVQTGDLIDRDLASFSTILPIFNTIKGPKYHVLGNHDFPVPTEQVVNLLNMPNQYYDFTYKDWRFIVLDTNDVSLYSNPKGSKKNEQAQDVYKILKNSNSINAQTWNGGVSKDQLTWLRAVLDEAAQKNEKVIVFSHMPVYPESKHNVWNDEAVIKELEAVGNVVAFFNGHYHGGNYAVKNGIHYVNPKGMIENRDTTSYSIVQVYNDRIEIDGYGRETDRVLKIQ